MCGSVEKLSCHMNVKGSMVHHMSNPPPCEMRGGGFDIRCTTFMSGTECLDLLCISRGNLEAYLGCRIQTHDHLPATIRQCKFDCNRFCTQRMCNFEPCRSVHTANFAKRSLNHTCRHKLGRQQSWTEPCTMKQVS